jgi:hypothetical protein
VRRWGPEAKRKRIARGLARLDQCYEPPSPRTGGCLSESRCPRSPTGFAPGEASIILFDAVGTMCWAVSSATASATFPDDNIMSLADNISAHVVPGPHTGPHYKISPIIP